MKLTNVFPAIYVKFYFFLLISILINVVGAKFNDVTCGSVIKLLQLNYKIRLHSHEVKYGSGSGQQSVTGVDQTEDVNSHWVIKAITGKQCARGESISCGDYIRLEHLTTGRNLHSHYFQSPLSSMQEVSAFGDGGTGDTGDHWQVMCDGDSWQRDQRMMLKHVDTNMYLAASGHTFGRPIHGQMEICAISQPDATTQWQVAEGVFIKPTDFNENKIDHEHEHTEL